MSRHPSRKGTTVTDAANADRTDSVAAAVCDCISPMMRMREEVEEDEEKDIANRASVLKSIEWITAEDVVNLRDCGSKVNK